MVFIFRLQSPASQEPAESQPKKNATSMRENPGHRQSIGKKSDKLTHYETK